MEVKNMRTRRIKRTFFIARRGAFVSGGLSKRHGPYLSVGYRIGPVKVKTSVGLQGHKASASVRPGRKTEVGIERNFTAHQTSVTLRHNSKKYNIPVSNK
jgi:hypothetical protein